MAETIGFEPMWAINPTLLSKQAHYHSVKSPYFLPKKKGEEKYQVRILLLTDTPLPPSGLKESFLAKANFYLRKYLRYNYLTTIMNLSVILVMFSL